VATTTASVIGRNRIVWPVRRLAKRSGRAVRLAVRIAPFWLKQPLYRWTPGGFGYYRKLRRCVDPGYVHERDKHPVRSKHFGAEGLKPPDAEGFVRRDYDSYDEYVQHQRQKLDEILRTGRGFSNTAVAEARSRFYRRFRHLIRLVPRDAVILCLGARQGTEVEVLRELGFRNSYGVDLNPGPENELVRPGDFNRLEEADGSIDLVYSNSVDHAFDLDAFFSEHARVLRAHGFALYDVHQNYRLGEPAPFEASLWLRREEVLVRALQHFERIHRLQAEPDWTWMLFQEPRRSA
jgi:SAM-dependent methyltransferase